LINGSFGGVLLVSLSDSSQPKPTGHPPSRPLQQQADWQALRPILGDSLALLSAVFYSLYVILLKVRIRSESRIDMQLFFGFVGLFNVLSCWPIGVVLHLTGVETFELPSTGKAITAIVINVISLLAYYSFLMSTDYRRC
jgi:solute carrier family 35 protein F5